MFRALFTIAVNALRGTARLFGYELKIVLTEHKIKTKFDKPSREGNCWDDSHWIRGNIFIKDIANPINIKKSDVEDEDVEIITSERYKRFMEQSLVDDMLQASKTGKMTVKNAVVILGSLIVLGIGVIYVLTTGGI
jgi:hypothetical protein